MGRNTKISRKLDNWLLSYLDWTLQRCDAPESALYLSGLFCLSATVRRRIYVGDDILGNWNCYPYLYIIYVGLPGSRKTTAVDQASMLLEELEKSGILARGPDSLSQAALIDSMVKSDDASLYITSHEFGELIMRSKEDMFTVLTAMFDGKRTYSGLTRYKGAEFAESPCINMAAGTTDTWIKENMSEAVIGGGFASRVLFMWSDGPRFIKLLYDEDEQTMEKINLKYREQLVHDLKHIAMLKGKFKFANKESRDYLKNWYHNLKQPSHRYLLGFHNRKQKHMLSLAMLHHIAYSDDLEFNVQDFMLAENTIKVVEDKLGKVFSGIGKNIYIFTSKDIYQYILQKGRVTKPELLSEFEPAATPDWIEKLIEGLIAMKKIKSEFDTNLKVIVYEVSKI